MKRTDKMTKERSGNIGRSYFWNAAYSGISAIQSFIILFAVSRTRELAEAGIITIGFTVANLMMILGGYGIRNYQVTDIKEEYSFSDYYYLRIITTGGAIFLSLIYLSVMSAFGMYSIHKSFIILEIVLLKLVDAFEGLYVGRLQQKGRLDIGSMIASVRIAISTTVVFGMLWICKSLHICFIAGFAVSVLIDLVLLPKGKRFADYRITHPDKKKIKTILLSAFPICLGMTLHNYIGNGPKYLVDLFMTDEIQAVSGYVMMPMFIITVLNSFLMQPMVKTLGDLWDRRDISKFRNLIVRHVLIISSLSFVVMIVGILVGLPILSLVYRIDLSPYKTEFVLLMIGGTFYTLSAYLIVLLTTTRKQGSIALGCVVAVFLYVVMGRFLVQNSGFKGASQMYIIANIAMMFVFVASLIKKCIKESDQ